MSHDADGAIRVLQEGLKPERPHSFAQADMLVWNYRFFVVVSLCFVTSLMPDMGGVASV